MMRKILCLLLALCLMWGAALSEQTEEAVKRLTELGYASENPDEEELQRAVSNFQRAAGLSVTGTADPTTLEKLLDENAPSQADYIARYLTTETSLYSFRAGDKGDGVSHLQQLLKAQGYLEGEITGLYDTETVRAVALYRYVNGFSLGGDADGEVVACLLSSHSISAAGFESLKRLEKGSEGAMVKRVQQLLKGAGYFTGSCTGVFGKKTLEAVKELQQDNGLTQDGVWDIYMTVQLLAGAYADKTVYDGAEQTLAIGDENYLVREMETELCAGGYLSLTPDNFFGPETVEAVMQFQEANGLPVTGKADGETRLLLKSGDYALQADYLLAMNENPLSVGDVSYGAYLLTQRMSALGYPVTPSWNYSEDIALMISVFQTATGLSVTGDTDTELRKYFNSKEALSYSSVYALYTEVMQRVNAQKNLDTLRDTALAQTGKPYAAGKTGPDEYGTGGFAYYCFYAVGTVLEPTAALQYEAARGKEGYNTDVTQMKTGDLAFIGRDGTVLSAVCTSGGELIFAEAEAGCVVKKTLTEVLATYEFLGSIGYIA